MNREFVSAEDSLLLIVDIQNDFCPGGALPVPGGDEIVPVVNRISRSFRHVALTQDWHPKGHISFASSHEGMKPFQTIPLAYGDQVLWPDHCVPGTRGAEFHARLETTRAEVIVRKGFHAGVDSYSAFLENDRKTPTGLQGYMAERGLRRLFLAGLATDFCVRYSALDARRIGFEVYVIEDAVRGIDVRGSVAGAWESMSEEGILRIHSRDCIQ